MWSKAMVFNIHQLIAIGCRQVGLSYSALYGRYTCLNMSYMSYKVHDQCMQDIGHCQYQLISPNHMPHMQLQGKTLGGALIAVTDSIPVCAGAAISRQRGKQEQMFAQ